MIKIKRLGVENLQSAKELFSLFQSEDGIQPTSASDRSLKKMLLNPQNMVLMAMEEETIIGGLVAYQFNMFKRTSDKLLLYEITLKKNYRGKGYGKQLIKSLIKLSKQHNINEILVLTSSGNEMANKLYLSTGAMEIPKTAFYKYTL